VKFWLEGGFLFQVENRVCQLTTDFKSGFPVDFSGALRLKTTYISMPPRLPGNVYLAISKVGMTHIYTKQNEEQTRLEEYLKNNSIEHISVHS